MVLNNPDRNKPDEKQPAGDPDGILRALEEISDEGSDPDRPFSEETKNALKTLTGMMKDAERRFSDGIVSINPERVSIVRRTARFMKRISDRGDGRVSAIEINPRVYPANLRLSTRKLILSGDDLAEFADLVEQTGSLEITPDLDGNVDLDFSISGLWKSSAEGEM